VNKKKLRQVLKTTLKILIPNPVQILFKKKRKNSEDLTIEKLNLEIKKRKGQTKDK
jgi:hypothetical protein